MTTEHEYMRAWVNLSFSGQFLLERLNEEMEDGLGISLIEQEFLGQIAKAGGKIRMIDLARHTWVSKAAVTKTVDRHEQRALVQRDPSPSDRRVIQVSLTSQGRRLLTRSRKVLHRFVKSNFANRLSDDEIRRLSRILKKLIESHDLWEALEKRLKGFNR